MAEIEVTDDQLVVHINGADRAWSLRSQLTIPLTAVVGAEKDDDEARKWLHGIRIGGTHIPGVISAGSFRSHGDWVFWDVHDPDRAVAILLKDWHYARLVVQVDDPDAAVGAIQKAVAH